MTALASDRVHEVGRAVLARVLAGEPARLDTIPSSIFSRDLAAIWSAAVGLLRTDGEVDPLALMSVADLDPSALSQLIGADERHLIQTAEVGVDRLAEYLRRRRVAELAESFKDRFLAGDGESTWSQLLAAHDAAVRRPDALVPVSPADFAPPSEPVPWLVPGYVARGDVTILCGDAGAGKTFLVDWWAIEAALRGDGVIFWQGEQPLRLVSLRVQKLLSGAGIVPEAVPALRYLVQPEADLSSDAGLAALRALIERERPALVVFDSLVRVMGKANPDRAEEVAAFFGRVFIPIARDYGCAVLVLHHLRKPSDSDDAGSLQHKVRGSSDIPAAVGSVLVLDRKGETRTLWQTKCRWQPEQPPVGITIEDVDHGVRVTVTGAAADAEELILNGLADAARDGLLRQEIVALLEVAGFAEPTKTATRKLGRLKARKRVFGHGSGRSGTRYWLRDLAPKEALTEAE